MPAAGSAPRSAAARIWLSMPRVLNEPACCVYSSLNHSVRAGPQYRGTPDPAADARGRRPDVFIADHEVAS